ncbi:MAG: thioredoxin [Ruminococcaceae bacterium]|nr:thioredoxin [Oscillospiraceae bacterium]
MSVLHLTAENFKSTIEGADKPVLVDFFAEWCMPCKMFAPILEKVGEKVGSDAVIAKINIDEAEAIAMEYGVMSIPTVILFKNGKEVQRHVGGMSAGEVLNMLKG